MTRRKQKNEFECAKCGGVFAKTRSDEDAMAESKDRFGAIPEDELLVVCDDCWLEMGFT